MSTPQELPVPSIISMEIDDDNEEESEYRLKIGTKVKYVKVAAATFSRDILSFPLAEFPPLPYQDDDWSVAYLSRDAESGKLEISLSEQRLAGVQNVWHSVRVDILDLERTELLTASTFEAIATESESKSNPLNMHLPAKNVIAKIARFEWEIPRIERETRAYQLLEQHKSRIPPCFLGHIHEEGRVIGFMVEKLENRRSATIEDLSACEQVLEEFHELGFLHGDVNRYNFLVGEAGVKIIDFERFQEDATDDARREEIQSLRDELVDESGRGAGFVFSSHDL